MKRTRGQGGLIKKKGSNFWYGTWTLNGRQVCRSTKTTVKLVAEAKLRRWMGRSESGLPVTELSKLRYEDLRNAYILTAKAKGRKSLYTNAKGETSFTSLKHADEYFKRWPVSQINPDAVRQFVLQRQAAGAKNGTINRTLAALKAMFRLAVKDGKLANIPHIELLREASPRQGFLTVKEYAKLFAALPAKLRPVLALGFYRGLRLGEIRKLRWDNLDLDAGVIRLAPGETKSNKGRVIPLNKELVTMLKELRPENGHSIFVFGNGRPLGSFKKTWYAACVRCGLGRFEKLGDGSRKYVGRLFHDLRRSAVMNMVQSGIDPTIAMAISGHLTDSIFKRYNIVTEARLLAAGAKADAFIEEQRRKLADKVIDAEVIKQPALPPAKTKKSRKRVSQLRVNCESGQ